MANHSIVHWYPDLEKHKCGYCKQLNTNCSYGMWAESLTVEDYQNLIDRGWRRSGKYCYKPVMDTTCCPLYTIRCEALNIKPSKSQKKILKRVNKYLNESVQENHQSENQNESNMDGVASDIIMKDKPSMSIDINKIDTSNFHIPIRAPEKTLPKEINAQNTNSNSHSSMSSSVEQKNIKTGYGADINKPPCKKAKLIRLERRAQKLAAKGITELPPSKNTNQGKSLEEFINEVSDNPAHQLKICLVRTGGHSKDWQKTKSQEYPVYKKYQILVHNDPPEKCSEKQFSSFLFESPLQLILKRMDPTEQSFKASAKLYEKYQMNIHNDSKKDCDELNFAEFLVTTPLEHTSPPDGPPSGYGSFHQQYWLDDKLIAVGVIDILPNCVSSVYFFYDPDYRHLTLGTYGSLREVEFTRQLNATTPDLKYYYMGFYIHSCPKMRYKANLSPSFLLCPETYDWFAIEKCIPMLNLKPYARFNEDIDGLDKNACDSSDIDDIMILINYRTCVPYKYFKRQVHGNEEEFILFGNLVGKKCVSHLLLILRDADFF